MAVRAPLKNNSGNLQEMTTANINAIVDQFVYQYSLSPSVVLSNVASGGSLGTITDTRKQAGAMSTSTTSFPDEATTAEPGTVTINYDKITSTGTSATPTADTGTTWPVYYTSAGHIRAMTLQDVKDTFLHPAIDLLTAATTTTQQAGTYFISSATTVTGSTEVSGNLTPVYSDTRADTSLYSAGEIGETLDQPTTITNYYLYRVDGANSAYEAPFYVNSGNHLQQYSTAQFGTLAQEWIKKTAHESADGYALSYNLGATGDGNERGSGMGDTILNGSGNHQTRFVNADDYRAQEFPDGTPVTTSTYFLRIHKS